MASLIICERYHETFLMITLLPCPVLAHDQHLLNRFYEQCNLVFIRKELRCSEWSKERKQFQQNEYVQCLRYNYAS